MRLGISIIGCVLTSSTMAGAPTDLFSASLEELLNIKVSSTSFFEESLTVTSYSVTPTYRRDWDKLDVRNVGELMNQMPSTVAPLGYGQSRVLAVRGYLGTGSPRGTAVRFDGVPMNKLREGGGAMPLDGYDLSVLQNVELIRGPGSSLHGNDAFHGVLSLNTVGAEDAASNVNFELGSLDYLAASGVTSMQNQAHSFTAAVAYRNIGDVEQPYSYTDQESGEPLTGFRKNARKSTNALVKYQYQRGPLTVDSSIYLMQLEAEQLPGVGEAIAGLSQQDQDYTDYDDSTQLARVAVNYQVNDAVSYQGSGYYWQYQDEFSVDYLRSFGIRNSAIREEGHWGVQFSRTQQFSEDSHFTLAYEHLNATLEKSSLKVWGQNDLVLQDWHERAESGYVRRLNSFVVDGHQQLNLSGLLFHYGLRLDAYNDFDEELSPRLGFTQSLPRGQKIHLTYGSAFRAPSTIELYGGTRTQANFELRPETLESLDIKYTLEQTHWLHALTLFRNHWDDAIRNALISIDPTPVTQFQNNGSNTAYGVEYESKGRWDAFEVDLTASYIRSKNVDTNSNYGAFPHWILGFNLGYKLNTHWSIVSNNRYMLRDEYSEDNIMQESAIDYFQSSLILRRLSGNMNFSVSVRNIFDRKNSFPDYQAHSDGLIDEGINVTSSVRYSF